jgi:hypothetical protein
VAGLMITTCESTNDLHLATAGGVVYLHVPREDAPADKIVVAVRRKSGASLRGAVRTSVQEGRGDAGL